VEGDLDTVDGYGVLLYNEVPWISDIMNQIGSFAMDNRSVESGHVYLVPWRDRLLGVHVGLNGRNGEVYDAYTDMVIEVGTVWREEDMSLVNAIIGLMRAVMGPGEGALAWDEVPGVAACRFRDAPPL
jgi:hypothetical protein